MSAAAAYERRFREQVVAGIEPDALRRFTPDEDERFWSYVIPGPEGHSFWDGPLAFTRNDGRQRRPRRWVWERTNGVELAPTTDVWAICGERNCVTAGHLAAGRSPARGGMRRDEMIGALQVAVLRLGHIPTQKWWSVNHMRPSEPTIVRVFGNWRDYVRAAGFEPARVVNEPANRPILIEAVRALATHLGHVPAYDEYRGNSGWLREHGFPTSMTTVRRHFDKSYSNLLAAAGLRRGA